MTLLNQQSHFQLGKETSFLIY